MKNISNLDIKRHRLGLKKQLSSIAVLHIYKKSGIKVKLELIGLIEVLKHTEKGYFEALELIYKLEKVTDSTALITKLSKQQLAAKVLADKERLAIAPKINPKSVKIPASVKNEPSYYQKHKTTILLMSGILGILVLLLLFKPSKPQRAVIKPKQETFIPLSPRNGHKYIYTMVNGVSTTFMLDTGASTSTVSKSYLSSHTNSGFMNKRTHFLRYGNYRTANGEGVRAEVWQIPSMTIGPKTIYNVEVAVMQGIKNDGFLLGMSTINKLGNPTIDLTNNKIIIN